MEEKAKRILLDIARNSIRAAIQKEPNRLLSCSHPDLQGKFGVFVTLKTYGQLRGCIGHFFSDVPLFQLVSEMAAAAATDDPRFAHNRITLSELEHLDIEISVLSPLTRISNPLDFELGRHGIYIKKGFSTGCFLPQVATETGWSKEDFLSYCCSHKASLQANAWKQRDTEIYIFTTEIIEEEK